MKAVVLAVTPPLTSLGGSGVRPSTTQVTFELLGCVKVLGCSDFVWCCVVLQWSGALSHLWNVQGEAATIAGHSLHGSWLVLV